MFISLLLSLAIFFQIFPSQTNIAQNYQGDSNFLPTGSIEEKLPQRLWENKSLGIKISAKSAVIIDKETKEILWQKNIKEKLSIASLTKLVTALVFLDHNLDWEKVIEIKKEDNISGASLSVKPGEKVKLKDLFYASLIGSTNNGIKALVRSTGLSENDFVLEMNKKVRSLSLIDTSFVDSTGLAPENISTAYDLAMIAENAFSCPEIKEALVLKEYSFKIEESGRTVMVKNTDKLLGSFLNDKDGEYKIVSGKTGSLDEAGYCLAIEVEKENNSIIAIVLGSQGPDVRFQEAKGLIVWTFENYRWQ